MPPDVSDLKIQLPEPAPNRKWTAGRLAILSLLGLTVLMGVGWWWRTRSGPEAPPAQPVPVKPAPAKPAGFSAGGYLEVVPPWPLSVSVLAPGRIDQVHALEGQEVKEGQLLCTLFSRPFEIAVQSAEAACERASARAEALKKAAARNRQLLEIGAAAAKSVEESDMELATALADLKKAEAELDRAKMELDQTQVRSPADGVILERRAQPGDWIGSSGGERASPALFSIYDPKRLQAWVDVNQKDMAQVRIGQAVHLVTDAQPSRQVRGRVLRILPKANLQKNTVQVKAEIPDPPADFRPEMSVKVTFVQEE